MGGRNNSWPASGNESSPVTLSTILMKKPKVCDRCFLSANKLFRCRYNFKKEWVFLCEICLKKIKTEYSDSYQYGGTKKIKGN